jgi:hypothetical protein
MNDDCASRSRYFWHAYSFVNHEIIVKYNARVLVYVIIVFLSFFISFEQMFILIEKEFDIKNILITVQFRT